VAPVAAVQLRVIEPVEVVAVKVEGAAVAVVASTSADEKLLVTPTEFFALTKKKYLVALESPVIVVGDVWLVRVVVAPPEAAR
jgi:hypothetical protein